MIMWLSLIFDILGMRPSDGDESFRRFLDNRGSNKGISWADWGPQCTRLLPQNYNREAGEQHLIGGHFVMLECNEAPHDIQSAQLSFVFRLYDFRPEIVARYAQSFPQEVCTDTTLVPEGNSLDENVFSNLPFHVVTSKELPRSTKFGHH